MHSIEFPEQTVIIAKNQPQYNPLPAHVEGGVVTSCWEPTEDELDFIRGSDGRVKVYISQCTFGAPVQPLAVQLEFNPPKLPQPEPAAPPPRAELIAKHELEKLAKCRGLSGPILFAVDPASSPGEVISHFVRFDTVALDEEAFKAGKFVVLQPDVDPRLDHLASSFTKAADQANRELAQCLSLAVSALDIIAKVPRLMLPPQVRDFATKAMRAGLTVLSKYR